MSASAVAQTRICVEKILPKHHDEYHQMYETANSSEHLEKLRAAFFSSKLWPKDATIRYAFTETGNQIPRTPIAQMKSTRGKDGKPLKIDPLQKAVEKMSVQDAVRRIVRERIQPIVSVKLIYVSDPSKANIRISFDPDGGAWSLIGTDCLHERSKPTMNLGWFDVATTLHEFGHALGMVHEHQNPHGNPIKWDYPRVYSWAETTQGWDHEMTEKNILNKYANSQINGSQFDPQSIMLYFFPGKLTTNNVGTHQNLRLSGLDVTWLGKMYPQTKTSLSAFYDKIYDESLSESIDVSEEEDKEFTSGTWMSKKTWLIIGGVVLAIILVGILFWWWRRRSSRRSNNLSSIWGRNTRVIGRPQQQMIKPFGH